MRTFVLHLPVMAAHPLGELLDRYVADLREGTAMAREADGD